MPTKDNVLQWLTEEIYPRFKDTIDVVDNNASMLARSLYKVRTQLSDVEDYLAKKIQVVAPLSVLEVEDPVTHVKSLRFSVATTSTSPSGTVDDGTIRVTPLDTKEYAEDKFFGVSPIRTTVFQKSSGAKAIQISIDPAVTDPTAGAVLYPAELATPNTPTTTYAPVVTSAPDQEVIWNYNDDMFVVGANNGGGYKVMTLPDDQTLYFTGLKLEVLQPFEGPSNFHFRIKTRSSDLAFDNEAINTRFIPSETDIILHGGEGADIGLAYAIAGTTYYSMAFTQECVGQGIRLDWEADGWGSQLTAGSFRLTATFERRSVTNGQRFSDRYLASQYPLTTEVSSITALLNTKQGYGDSMVVPASGPGPAERRRLTGLKMTVSLPWASNQIDDEVYCEVKDSVGNVIIPPTNLTAATENMQISTGLLDSDFSTAYLGIRVWCTVGRLHQIQYGQLFLEYAYKDVSSAAPTITGHNLLTGAQLSSQLVNQEDALISGNLSAPGEVSLGQQFFTLAGTPGVTEIPAGPFTFDVLCYVNGTSAGVTNSIRAKMMVWQNGQPAPDAPFLTATSGNVSNTTPQVVTFTGNLAAPVTISPLDLIGVDYFAVTDGNDLRGFTVLYNEITRQTRITTTITGIVGGGSIVHNSTTARDAAACHPESAVTQNVATGTVTSGILTVPAGFRAAIVPNSGNLSGMVGDGTIRLFFPYSLDVLHGQTVGSGYPFWLPAFGTETHYDLSFTQPMGSAVFQLVTHASANSGNPCWILVSSMNY
jgi:hypothetical protein